MSCLIQTLFSLSKLLISCSNILKLKRGWAKERCSSVWFASSQAGIWSRPVCPFASCRAEKRQTGEKLTKIHNCVQRGPKLRTKKSIWMERPGMRRGKATSALASCDSTWWSNRAPPSLSPRKVLVLVASNTSTSKCVLHCMCCSRVRVRGPSSP